VIVTLIGLRVDGVPSALPRLQVRTSGPVDPIMATIGGLAMRQVTVGDVMTREVITVDPQVGFKEIADLLVNHSVSAVPVIDANGVVVRVVSGGPAAQTGIHRPATPPCSPCGERERTGRRRTATAADLMTASAVTIEVSVSHAARALEAARIKRLPVVDDTTVCSASCPAVTSCAPTSAPTDSCTSVLEILDALWIDPNDVIVECTAGVVRLDNRMDRRSTAGSWSRRPCDDRCRRCHRRTDLRLRRHDRRRRHPRPWTLAS
jgi:CBS domain-containing protein